MGQPTPASDEKPFDSQPFDAGVDADENSDPKKFIEQLTGKLGQSLRKYNEAQGQPDFELEKFAINSLLSATHTSEMTPEDQKDIIGKIEKSGGEGESSSEPAPEEPTDKGGDEMGMGDEKSGGLEESGFILNKPKRLSIFAPEGSEEAKHNLTLKKDLNMSENRSIFGIDFIKTKLMETFQDTAVEPMVEPAVKPDTKPSTPSPVPAPSPSRRDRPFLPMPNTQPDPKASK